MEKADIAGIEHIGNPRFLELLEQVRHTHIAKAAGYSGQDNPDTWTNFREAVAWGSTPLQGCFIRMGDKYRRIQNLRRNADNDRVGESVKVTLLDLANYCLIAICLLEEEEQAAQLKSPIPEGGLAAPIRDAYRQAQLGAQLVKEKAQ